MEKLNKSLKALLVDLLVCYGADKGKHIEIADDGTAILSRKSFFPDIFPERLDFLTIVQSILDKIVSEKKDMTFPSALSAKAIGVLMTTNDRAKVIKLMYTAYLIEEDPTFSDVNPEEDNVEVTFTKDLLPVSVNLKKYKQGINMSEIIAEYLNNTPDGYIIFPSKR